MFEFRLKFHWSLFLRVQLTIFQHWFRKWLGAAQVTSHYLNQWWLNYRPIYASLGLNELKRNSKNWFWWIDVNHLPIHFRVDSLAPGQSYDCSSTSIATLKDMGKLRNHLTTIKHNKAQKMHNHCKRNVFIVMKFSSLTTTKHNKAQKCTIIEIEMSSFWWNFHHWLPWKLSKW